MTTKLIAAFAAMTAGIAMADVSSANVVGYQTFAANQGFTMLTPSFMGIGKDIDVQAIKLVGDNVLGEGGESLQLVNMDGDVDESYTWYAAGMLGDKEGWYSDDSYEFAERAFGPAESMLFNNDEGEYEIQISGQVNYDAIPAFSCNQGFTSIGNMTPVKKGIQKFVLAGDNVLGEGGESLQMLDPNGDVNESYTWYAAGMLGDKEGWYSDDSYEFANRELEAGLGFLINNDEGEYTVSIPATND